MPEDSRVFGPACGQLGDASEEGRLDILARRAKLSGHGPACRDVAAPANARSRTLPQRKGRDRRSKREHRGGATWRRSSGPPAATTGRVRLLARALHLDHDAAHQRRSYVLQGMRRERGIPRHRTHRSMIALSARIEEDVALRITAHEVAGAEQVQDAAPNGGCAPERSRLVRRGRRERGQRRSRRAVCGYPARPPWHPAQAAKARLSTCFHSLSLLIHLVSILEAPNLCDHPRPRCEPVVSRGDGPGRQQSARPSGPDAYRSRPGNVGSWCSPRPRLRPHRPAAGSPGDGSRGWHATSKPGWLLPTIPTRRRSISGDTTWRRARSTATSVTTDGRLSSSTTCRQLIPEPRPLYRDPGDRGGDRRRRRPVDPDPPESGIISFGIDEPDTEAHQLTANRRNVT